MGVQAMLSLERARQELIKLAFGEEELPIAMQSYQIAPGITAAGAAPAPVANIAHDRSQVVMKALTGATIGATLGDALGRELGANEREAQLLGMAAGGLLGASSGLPKSPPRRAAMPVQQGGVNV